MALFGMARTVVGNLFSRPATRRYPSPQHEPHGTPRSRGKLEIDIAACIFCGACVKRCPTAALVVARAEREWSIDRLRCCTCNACVEVCPKKCLAMSPRPPAPTVTKDKEAFRQPPTAGGNG
jgi:formate hydrogenlyase subunit 6/NADH:ubiquinone oxidoreductase subunit I